MCQARSRRNMLPRSRSSNGWIWSAVWNSPRNWELASSHRRDYVRPIKLRNKLESARVVLLHDGESARGPAVDAVADADDLVDHVGERNPGRPVTRAIVAQKTSGISRALTVSDQAYPDRVR